VTECEQYGHGKETIAALRDVLNSGGQTLKLELAMSVDAFEKVVQDTYILEGDGVLSFRVFDMIMGLQAHVVAVRQGGGSTPNTRAVAAAIVEVQYPHLLAAAKAQRTVALVQEQLDKVERSFVYFEHTIITGMATTLAIYKAFRLLDPARIDILGADSASVEMQLKLIPFFSTDEVAALMAQLAAYRALAIGEGMDDTVDRESWWEHHAHTAGVDCWYAAATKVMICQPSSAAAERVFSMLLALMGPQQQARALQGTQEAAIMARYNGLQRGDFN
jgi:hypothetical protein